MVSRSVRIINPDDSEAVLYVDTQTYATARMKELSDTDRLKRYDCTYAAADCAL
jgi:hypothetical protein